MERVKDPLKLFVERSRLCRDGRFRACGISPERSLKLKSRVCRVGEVRMERGIDFLMKFRERLRTLIWSRFPRDSDRVPDSFLLPSSSFVTLPVKEELQVIPVQLQQLSLASQSSGFGSRLVMKSRKALRSRGWHVRGVWDSEGRKHSSSSVRKMTITHKR